LTVIFCIGIKIERLKRRSNLKEAHPIKQHKMVAAALELMMALSGATCWEVCVSWGPLHA